MAPEMLAMEDQRRNDRKGYTKAVDFWGLGCTMYMLLTGKLPFLKDELRNAHETPVESDALIEAKVRESFSTIPGLPTCSGDIVIAFLKISEEHRLGYGANDIRTIKAHPFFQGLRWHKLVQKHIVPPFLPSVAPPQNNDDVTFDSFSAMMKSIGLGDWMNMKVPNFSQSHFETW
jgi:serine/threonine protein kinase